jgi:hypothetical protein
MDNIRITPSLEALISVSRDFLPPGLKVALGRGPARFNSLGKRRPQSMEVTHNIWLGRRGGHDGVLKRIGTQITVLVDDTVPGFLANGKQTRR